MKKLSLFFSLFSFLSVLVLNGQINQDCSGNIGIGISTPSTIGGFEKVLDVRGYNSSKLTSSTTVGSITTSLMSSQYGDWGGVGTQSNHQFYLMTNNTPRLTVNTSGYIGIGTISPDEKLQISSGDVYISGSGSYWIKNNDDDGNRLRMHHSGSAAYIDYYPSLYIRSGSTSSITRFYLNSNGNMGLGRSPSYKLDVNGDIRVNATIYSSDSRLKSNMIQMESSLDALLGIKAYTYNYNSTQIYEEGIKDNSGLINDMDSTTVDTTELEYFGFDFDNKIHYGFDASEIRELFPDVVYEDEKGYLGIDYIAFIPMLVQALKEQNSIAVSFEEQNSLNLNSIEYLLKEVESLKSELNDLRLTCCNSNNEETLKSASLTTSGDNTLMRGENRLFQNAPNPFNQVTNIRYYLCDDCRDAMINIYDLNGKQLRSINLHHTGGYGNIEISANEFGAGLYFYTLLSNGKVIDTKQMVLTD